MTRKWRPLDRPMLGPSLLRFTGALGRAMLVCAGTAALGQTDPVRERGLRHSALDRPLVAKAVERANRMLVETGIQLQPSWAKPVGTSLSQGSVPVYLVASEAAAAATPAAVPSGCRCIFVNTALLGSWARRNSSGPGRMTLDRGYFLTFILLHEAGHIAKGTAAAAFENGRLSQLNIEPSRAKASEEDADEFAATLLRRYSRQAKADSTSLEANQVVNELFKLGWNMQAYRSLDEFGAFAVGKPGVFFDAGYSHPNLAWRILRCNHLIRGSEATRELLEAFEDARRRGADPKPLYERSSGDADKPR